MHMVEWKNKDKSCEIHTWGDFCEIIKGNGVQKVDFVEEGFGCIHYGQIYTHYGPYTYSTNKFVSKDTFEKARKASKGDVIMTDTSENVEDICKSVAYLGEDDIAVSNHAFILKHNQNPKFLSYSTLTDCFLAQKRKVVVGVKVSGIKPEQLAKFKIYLPSLSEQERIVGILDTFSSSIDNLKRQIAQRRKQYEYYREQIINSSDTMTKNLYLGDIAIVKTGTKPAEILDVGIYKYINAGTTESGFVNSYNCDGDVVTTPSRGQGGIGFVGYQSSPFWLGPLCYQIRPNNKILVCKYLFYYLSSHNDKIMKLKSEGGTPAVNRQDLIKIKIPVPSLSEQQRIVDILDKFEASIQNLEAQLSQREKQYEYYRNRLLTFE